MADDKAAFGVFPQMKAKRSKQDREAAKNVPIDLARGALSGVLGAPGDIESLIRMLPGLSEETILPTSEDIEKRLPFRSETPVSQAATGLGQLGGGFYTGRGSPLRAIAAVPSAVKRAAKDFAEASAASAPHVIKPKGGNWLTGSVEKAVEPLKQGLRNREYEALIRNNPDIPPERAQRFRESMQLSPEDQAINKWIESNLTNYIKKEMATPEDPVRKLAEEGILHKPIDFQDEYNRIPSGDWHRSKQGTSALGQSELAKAWENLTDVSISNYSIDDLKKLSKRNPEFKGAYEPWMKKAEPNTKILYPNEGLHPSRLGFDHIVDVLKEDLATGRIRPEQLSKVSMEQAVRRTFEYDQELAAKMNAARAAAREGLPVHKEYPEGYRWVELNKPGAFATESEAMGHSVRGYEPPQGHPDWVEGSGDMGHLGYGHGGWEAIKSGKAKVYSLVDPKGEPHVTVEVGAKKPQYEDIEKHFDEAHKEVLKEMNAQGLDTSDPTKANALAWKRAEEIALQTPQMNITQIKGKQNRAPKEEYLPYVQDFVRGGQWSDVGDIQNTGLYKVDKDFLGGISAYMPESEDIKHLRMPQREEALIKAIEAKDLPESGYVTRKEWEEAIRKHGRPTIGEADDDLLRQLQPPEEGMKRGGVVISDNPDTMMLELQEGRNAGGAVNISDNPDAMMMDVGDREFAGGGIVKRLARAPAKSKQEIEAIAERIAPQVTGEFVRKPKETQSVAGKTQKQFAREKELPVEFTDVKPVPKVEVLDPESLKGMVVTGVPGDPTVTGKSLVSVGDIKLDSPSPQHGGPLYGLGRNDDIFWASGIDPAGRVQTVAKEAMQAYDAPVAGQYIMMGPDSINYAQHFADANLSAIDLSKMTKRQIEDFNKLIRFGNEKSGPRPSFPGIENKEDAYLHFAFDPSLRKHFNEIMQMPTVTERFNLPSGQDIRFAITEAPLRDLETGVTGFSMGRLAPEVPKSALPLSEHPTYSHDIPGQFIGGLKYPTPYELSFPDTLKSVMEHSKQRLAPFNSLKYVGPRQIYDQQMIDELKMYEDAMKRLTGKKKGGKVEKAEDGLIRVKNKRKAKA